MPKVRLAGTVRGERDPNRESRARLLYSLFRNGWDIINSNGDQRVTLCNIEAKIVESDAFVFTPGATLEDLFKVVSIFVGYQTLDRNLAAKPTVLLNSDRSWDRFFALLRHLEELDTVSQDHRDYLFEVDDVEQVHGRLSDARVAGAPEVGRAKAPQTSLESYDSPLPPGHAGNVCVFCSATTRNPGFLADGYGFGRGLAGRGLGCVSGAGKSGIMGEVVRGSLEAGGWAGGSNVPHIIEIEGLPEGLSSFWLRPDIYTRMEVMIERSDAFVIFPGGAGTVQEMLALMIFKHHGHPAAKDKPVVVYNRKGEDGTGFWTPMIELLADWCENGEFRVVEDFDTLLPTVEGLMEEARVQVV